MTESLTEFEVDSLQEIMNIAFGGAAADLAEVVDVFVQLSSPQVEMLLIQELENHLRENVPAYETARVVEQHYRGESNGVALLVFPHGSEHQLVSLFQPDRDELMESDTILELEKEVLMEVGNILIGACVGRLFDLLKRTVTYLPPRTTGGHAFSDLVRSGSFTEDDYVITIQTRFDFDDREVSGRLFLVNRQNALMALKDALADFWSNLE
jgi:chemotaxis protein CheC